VAAAVAALPLGAAAWWALGIDDAPSTTALADLAVRYAAAFCAASGDGQLEQCSYVLLEACERAVADRPGSTCLPRPAHIFCEPPSTASRCFLGASGCLGACRRVDLAAVPVKTAPPPTGTPTPEELAAAVASLGTAHACRIDQRTARVLSCSSASRVQCEQRQVAMTGDAACVVRPHTIACVPDLDAADGRRNIACFTDPQHCGAYSFPGGICVVTPLVDCSDAPVNAWLAVPGFEAQMLQHEVTREEFLCFARERGDAEPRESHGATRQLPVTSVGVRDAVAYCTWLGARLPAQTEWEAAAAEVPMPTGDHAPCASVAPVGASWEPRSRSGFADLISNAVEYVTSVPPGSILVAGLYCDRVPADLAAQARARRWLSKPLSEGGSWSIGFRCAREGLTRD
jgi:hypothetical protein